MIGNMSIKIKKKVLEGIKIDKNIIDFSIKKKLKFLACIFRSCLWIIRGSKKFI